MDERTAELQRNADSVQEFKEVMTQGFSSLQEQLLAQCKQVFTENEHLRSELRQPRENIPEATTRMKNSGKRVEIESHLKKPRAALSSGFMVNTEVEHDTVDFADAVCPRWPSDSEEHAESVFISEHSAKYSSEASIKVAAHGTLKEGSEGPQKPVQAGLIDWTGLTANSSSRKASLPGSQALEPLQWPADDGNKEVMKFATEQDFSPNTTFSQSDSRSVDCHIGSGGQVRTQSIHSLPIAPFVLHECFLWEGEGIEVDHTKTAEERHYSIQEVQSNRVSMIVNIDWYDPEIKRDCISRFLIVRPNCFTRLTWDFCGVLLIAYDIIMVPLRAFMPADYEWQDALTYATAIFWTVDIFLSFITGVFVDGLLEMKPERISRYYLQTWFVPDITIVVLDWADIFISLFEPPSGQTGSDHFRLGNWTRILRPVLRIFRLVRLCKLVRILRAVIDRLNSEIILMVMQILRLVLVILIINHYVACAWYGLGVLYDNTDNWVAAHANNHGTAYKYLTSLHWSLTQFTPASMEIFPTNEMERLFNICILIFGLITFSSFVSSITSAMSRLAAIRGSRHREETQLRHFLSQRKVSGTLGVQIRRYFRENYQVRKNRVHEIDIAFFTQLPIILRVALHAEIYGPVLFMHPLFKRYAGIDNDSVCSICHFATVQKKQLMGQNVFLTGAVGEDMLFVVSGELKYYTNASKAPHGCNEGQWFSEGVLWGTWYHRGRLSADANSELVGICGDTFRAISSERLSSFTYLKTYARSFQRHINAREEWGDAVTDLPLSIDILQDLVNKTFHQKSKGRNRLSKRRHG